MDTVIAFFSRFIVTLSAAILVGKVVYFNFFVSPVLNKILETQTRIKVTGALFPRYYYLGIACGVIIALAGMQLELQFQRWIATGTGLLVVAIDATCRFYFLPRLNSLKSVIEQLPEDERKGSREQQEWKKLQKFALRLNIVVLIAGLILIGRMS